MYKPKIYTGSAEIKESEDRHYTLYDVGLDIRSDFLFRAQPLPRKIYEYSKILFFLFGGKLIHEIIKYLT